MAARTGCHPARKSIGGELSWRQEKRRGEDRRRKEGKSGPSGKVLTMENRINWRGSLRSLRSLRHHRQATRSPPAFATTAPLRSAAHRVSLCSPVALHHISRRNSQQQQQQPHDSNPTLPPRRYTEAQEIMVTAGRRFPVAAPAVWNAAIVIGIIVVIIVVIVVIGVIVIIITVIVVIGVVIGVTVPLLLCICSSVQSALILKPHLKAPPLF
uniref:Uncharacterized protein LOC116951146 n=1 Tax=Petromyzon marinus TaxID=7757 RepID=A0AAJ7X914_PETMA|nr:uncharacterized protein LOC116951146 [Petromyzon marinus]